MKKNENPQEIVISVEHFTRLLSLAIAAGREWGNEETTKKIRQHVRRFNPHFVDKELIEDGQNAKKLKDDIAKARTLLNYQSQHPKCVFYFRYENYMIPVTSLGFNKKNGGWLRFQFVNKPKGITHWDEIPADSIFIDLPEDFEKLPGGKFKDCYISNKTPVQS